MVAGRPWRFNVQNASLRPPVPVVWPGKCTTADGGGDVGDARERSFPHGFFGKIRCPPSAGRLVGRRLDHKPARGNALDRGPRPARKDPLPAVRTGRKLRS